MAINKDEGHTKPVLRAALYARISPVGDQEPDANYSIPSQLRPMRELTEKMGWVSGPDLEFIDEHFSGKDLNRPALDRMRTLVRNREVDVVIYYTIDRMSRNLAHQLILAEEAKKFGVLLKFIQATYDNTPEGGLMFQIQGAVSQFEREKIRERTMRGRREKAQAGRITIAVIPYGYSYVRGDKRTRQVGYWVVNERESPVVKVIFQLAADGKSLRAICRYLHENGITPRKAAKWSAATIRSIISNPAFKGKASTNRQITMEPKKRRKPECRAMTTHQTRPESEWIWVDVPRIIEDDLWQAANDRMEHGCAGRTGRPSKRYLLSGHLFCGACGKRCGVFANHGYPHYLCTNRDRITGEWHCQVRRSVRLQKIEGVVWNALMDHLTNPELLAAEYDDCRKANDVNRDRRQKLVAGIKDQAVIMARAQAKILDPRYADTSDIWDAAFLGASKRKRELEYELQAITAGEVQPVAKATWQALAKLYSQYRDKLSFEFQKKMLFMAGVKVLYYADTQEIDIDARVSLAVPEAADTTRKCESSELVVDTFVQPLTPSFHFTIRKSLAAA
jgi:site-specific DNA recombinase